MIIYIYKKINCKKSFPTERRGGPLDVLHFQSQARLIEYFNYARKSHMVFWKTIKWKESSLEVSMSSLT